MIEKYRIAERKQVMCRVVDHNYSNRQPVRFRNNRRILSTEMEFSKTLYAYGRFSKNVQIHVTEFYLLEKALNSNWKWFHQTQHNVMNKRDFTEGIEVLRVLRKVCLNPPKCHKIACNSAAIAILNMIFIMRGRVKLNKNYPTYLDYRLL